MTTMKDRDTGDLFTGGQRVPPAPRQMHGGDLEKGYRIPPPPPPSREEGYRVPPPPPPATTQPPSTGGTGGGNSK